LGHTLYARFFTKFFKDLGLVEFSEFAQKRVQHGIVLGPDGNKMSKSKGNVINPDDVVREFGVDAVRVYLSFMMPYQATGPWAPGAMYGSYRFLKRVWDLQSFIGNTELSEKDLFEMHRTIKKVTEDVADNRLNTAVAAMMEWLNFLEAKGNRQQAIPLEEYKTLLQLLSPFAPHMAEELWQLLGQKDNSYKSIHLTSWPKFNPEFLKESTVTIVVQVNGKLRSQFSIDSTLVNNKEEVEKLAMSDEKIIKHLDGKSAKKIIYVPGKLINIVV